MKKNNEHDLKWWNGLSRDQRLEIVDKYFSELSSVQLQDMLHTIYSIEYKWNVCKRLEGNRAAAYLEWWNQLSFIQKVSLLELYDFEGADFSYVDYFVRIIFLQELVRSEVTRRLTNREAKILHVYLRLGSTQVTAIRVGKSIRTIESVLNSVKWNLGSRNRYHLVIKGIEFGIITYADWNRKRCEPFEELTYREREVLHLIVFGCSHKEIAELLCVSVRTVEGYAHKIRVKWGVTKYNEVIFTAIKMGYLKVKIIENSNSIEGFALVRKYRVIHVIHPRE